MGGKLLSFANRGVVLSASNTTENAPVSTPLPEPAVQEVDNCEARERYYQMVEYLRNLRGRIKATNVAERKKLLAHLPDEGLLDLIQNSDILKWTKNPSYYRAIAEILNEHGVTQLSPLGELPEGFTLAGLGDDFGIDLFNM